MVWAFNVGTSAAVPGASHNGPNPSVTDEVSWVKGQHQFLFGGNLYWQEMNYWSGLNAVGSMTFNGSSGTGLGMTDMLLGLASGFSQGTAYGFYNRQWYTSLYAQDTWKASRKLTVNYGVRWEPTWANTTSGGSSNAPLNSALFGLINSDQSGNIGGALQVNAGDYRIVQVAAKIVF